MRLQLLLPAVARAAPSFRASSLRLHPIGLVLLILWTFRAGARWGREGVKLCRSGFGAAWGERGGVTDGYCSETVGTKHPGDLIRALE